METIERFSCLLFLAHQNNLCLYFSSMYLYKKYTWIILIHYYIVPLLLYFCLFEGEFNSFTHIVVPTVRTCFYSLTLCFLFVLLFLFLFSPLLSFFTQYLFTHLLFHFCLLLDENIYTFFMLYFDSLVIVIVLVLLLNTKIWNLIIH